MSQYHHISDVAPTILEATGVSMYPRSYHGVKQQPLDGTCRWLYSPSTTPTRPIGSNANTMKCSAIARSGSTVGRPSRCTPIACRGISTSCLPFDKDKWELYQRGRGLLGEHGQRGRRDIPNKLEEVEVQIFEEEAWKYNVYPLYDDMIKRISAQQQTRLFGDQKGIRLLRSLALFRIAEKASVPVKNRSHDDCHNDDRL